MKLTSFILVTASLAYLANATSITKRDAEQDKIVDGCLNGIQAASNSASSLAKDLKDVVKGKADAGSKFETSVKQADKDIDSFRPTCREVTVPYNEEQTKKLLKGLLPLLKSVNEFYEGIVDHKKELADHEETIKKIAKNINDAMGDLAVWKSKFAVPEVLKKTKEPIEKTGKLAEGVTKAYGLK